MFMSVMAGEQYDVVEIFETVIKNAPYGDYAAPSQYKIGLFLMEKRQFQEARDEFEKVINDYPESEWAKAAKYQIATADAKRAGSAQYEQATTEVAVQQFEEFLEEFPDAELSDEAKEQVRKLRDTEAENSFVIAEFYEKRKNPEAAKIYYQDIIDDYPNTKWAIKALRKIRNLN